MVAATWLVNLVWWFCQLGVSWLICPGTCTSYMQNVCCLGCAECLLSGVCGTGGNVNMCLSSKNSLRCLSSSSSWKPLENNEFTFRTCDRWIEGKCWVWRQGSSGDLTPRGYLITPSRVLGNNETCVLQDSDLRKEIAFRYLNLTGYWELPRVKQS